jgi:hypothetical protein
MIQQTMSLLGALYETLGPGLLLVASLPALLVLSGVVTGVVLRRFRRRGEAA